MRISVIGTGYLGATHAACLAHIGHDVIGIDVDADLVDALQSGVCPFGEPGLPDLLADGLRTGRLRLGTTPEQLAHNDVHFICVGTPQVKGGSDADLKAVWSAVDMVAEHSQPAMVVGKSTVPVGTAEAIQRRLGDDWLVGWNPEFLREGHAVEDSLRPERIVLGTNDDNAHAVLRDVYAPILSSDVPLIRTDFATAELAKSAANVMLASRIAVVNALAEVCEAGNANVYDLVRILGSDTRIGSQFLSPGIGFGGSCLPKDVRAFVARAREMAVGDSMALFQEVDNVNMRQRARAVDRVLSVVSGPAEGSANVAVLGAAFKPGSDDVRDSPALDVASSLHALGVGVCVYDPAAIGSARRVSPELTYADDLESACRGVDAVLVLTDWPEFAGIDPVSLAEHVRRTVVFDGRLVLDADKWKAAGWDFHAVGHHEEPLCAS